MEENKTGIVKDKQIIQLGFLVKDIEKTKVEWAKFLGVPVPETVNSGEYAVTKTVYEGQPVPEAMCYMTFFYLGNLQMELIQPNTAKSAWHDHLERFGEGLHHIAFSSADIEGDLKPFAENGMPAVQRGIYRHGNGEYAFIDASENLKTIVELLQTYK